MKETKLTAKPRTVKGKAEAGRMRRMGWFPAVVYGEGRPGTDIQMNEHDFVMVLRNHRSGNMIVDLAVEGSDKPCKVMLKAMQHHPITGRVMHVDFYEINMARKIDIEIPVRLAGDPVGVVSEGGILEHVLRLLKVQCLPGDLIEEVSLDVSGLGIGKTLRIRDIPLDREKYKIQEDEDQVVATVAAPRKEEEPAAAAEGAAASPEVITEKKPEEDAAKADAKGEKKEEKKK